MGNLPHGSSPQETATTVLGDSPTAAWSGCTAAGLACSTPKESPPKPAIDRSPARRIDGSNDLAGSSPLRCLPALNGLPDVWRLGSSEPALADTVDLYRLQYDLWTVDCLALPAGVGRRAGDDIAFLRS